MASTKRVADVLRSGPATLTSCQTVSQLREQKPDVGAVLLGGNYLGPHHSLQDPDKLDCTVDAKHVCKASFVSSARRESRCSNSVLLAHNATAADLKREFYRLQSRQVAAAMTASGAFGVSEQECVHAIECKDPDGRVIADNEVLPRASATACADVGCHSHFFLDVKPSSMKKHGVETRLPGVSSEAVKNFIRAPRDIGAWPYQPEAAYPEAFATVHAELMKRLRSSTRPVPAVLSPAPLQELSDFFQSQQQRCGPDDPGSNLPLIFERSLRDLIGDIQERRADALNLELPRMMAGHMSELKPFVAELVRQQKKGEWSNYQNVTEYFDSEGEALSIDDIVEKLQDKQKDLKLHEDIHLEADNTANMSQRAKRENKDECGEFNELYSALHSTFERTLDKRTALTTESYRCMATCEESLRKAKSTCEDAKSGYKATLQDETSNVKRLQVLKDERDSLHTMVNEQIKWCKDFVEVSKQESQKKKEALDREIARLQTLSQAEGNRLQELSSCDTYLDTLKREEKVRAQDFERERSAAMQNAAERKTRAEKGVASSAKFVAKLGELQEEVQKEMKDAVDYLDQLLKQLGVDCHTAYLSTGKFLAIQSEVATSNREKTRKDVRETVEAALEAERLEDDDLDDTVERADKARAARDKAERALKTVEEKISQNEQDRKRLKSSFHKVYDLLRGGVPTPRSSNQAITVDRLPEMKIFAFLETVAEYREYRADLAVTDAAARTRTLDRLEDHEREFERRYRGEANDNFARRLSTAVQSAFGRAIGM